MKELIHSVTLIKEKCTGCTTCITHCPTEAIRVRKGKAEILKERCTDCGVCIRVCPSHAKTVISDELSDLSTFKKTAAITAPSLYGQFETKHKPDKILGAVKALGFDYIAEAAMGAEIAAKKTDEYINNHKGIFPLISSSCPAVVRLIQVRFPSLIENLCPIESPMEITAEYLKKKYGEDTGVFFISPCPAKISAVKNPLGREGSNVDGVLPIKNLFLPISKNLSSGSTDGVKRQAGTKGIGWATSEGEASSLQNESYVSVDGINYVMALFEQLENGDLESVKFIEAMACPGGCVGGSLMMENPHIARMRVRNILKEIPAEENRDWIKDFDNVTCIWDGLIEPKQLLKLDDDMLKAMEKMAQLEAIEKTLPGLDCGSCGAPNCRALAEDIVRGRGDKMDCIFILREEIRHLVNKMVILESRMPPSLDNEGNNGS